ncbi:MAG: DnaJ domain-containing protein [Spirochaetota bacterium]
MDFDTIRLDLDEILKYLKNSKNQPVIETEMLKHFFSEYDDIINYGLNLDTFKIHFVLYHHLYKLSRKLLFENSDYYIYIKYIYIYLLKLPEKGRCRYFNKELESFCNEKINDTDKDTKYCLFHREIENDKDKKLNFLDISHYYLDFNNYYKMDAEGLDKTMKGLYKYMKSRDIIEESFDVLSLSMDAPYERIHQRFKYLSKIYHPDVSKEKDAEKKYMKISNAFQVLKDYYESLN